MRKVSDSGDECTCDEQCPGRSCACIYIIDERLCICQCALSGGGAYAAGRGLTLEKEVNIRVAETDLATFGSFLSALCDSELLIPVATVHEKVSFTLKNVRLADVIRHAGLVVSDRKS
jgi:hypothetical protein